jgi:hypothetical protein
MIPRWGSWRKGYCPYITIKRKYYYQPTIQRTIVKSLATSGIWCDGNGIRIILKGFNVYRKIVKQFYSTPTGSHIHYNHVSINMIPRWGSWKKGYCLYPTIKRKYYYQPTIHRTIAQSPKPFYAIFADQSWQNKSTQCFIITKLLLSLLCWQFNEWANFWSNIFRRSIWALERIR